MKASEACKAAGLKSLAELAQISGKPVATLSNWWNKERRHFVLMLWGAVMEKTAKHGEPLEAAAARLLVLFAGDDQLGLPL